MNTPLISVIVPVYNTPEKPLRACLDSVVEQSLKNIEIILVDDVSTDGSLDILKEYAQKDSRIILIQHEKNSRVAVSRNTGIAAATGTYLYLIDCDDWIEPNTLECVYKEAEEKQVEVLFFGGNACFENDDILEEYVYLQNGFYYHASQEKIQDGLSLLKEFLNHKNYHPMVWLLLINREWYHTVSLSFYDVIYADDEVFMFDLFHKAKKVFCMNEKFYNYCMRTGSGMTRKRTYDFISGLFISYMQIMLTYKENKENTLSKEEFLAFLEPRLQLISRNYLNVLDVEPTLVKETLLNINHLLQGEPLEKLPNWDDFKKKQEKGMTLCFFGAGLEGKFALDLFQKHGFAPPLGICDNDQSRQGGFLDGIPIFSLDEAVARFNNLHILITNNSYYDEIYSQIEEQIGKDRILSLSR